MARRIEIDAATNGTTFNMETIKNKFVEKVKELEKNNQVHEEKIAELENKISEQTTVSPDNNNVINQDAWASFFNKKNKGNEVK